VTYRKTPTASPNIERRPAVLVLLDNRAASVRFRDGTTYAMPAAPFVELGMRPGQQFMLVLSYAGKRLSGARIEPFAAASTIERKVMPKIQVRDVNGRLSTRQS